MELYKKYRPKDFNEVFGNETVVETLEKKLEAKNLPHFMIFSGPPGCGKTTCSRILKNRLGVRDIDFFEINASSDNSVDLARAVSEKVQYKPLGGGTARLWLFDEAHRLTSACLAAMLKVLEDCPAHAYFIFATSEATKLSAAIKSRATIFEMKPLEENQMKRLIRTVCKKEGISIPAEAYSKIIETSNGQSRNALVALDAIKDLSPEEMAEAIEKSTAEEGKAFELLKSLLWSNGKWNTIAEVLKDFSEDPESTRRYLLSCACNQLKDPSKAKNHEKAFELAYCMKKPFYDNGINDLIFACREYWENVFANK